MGRRDADRLVAEGGEVFLEQLTNFRVVFDDEDPRGGGSGHGYSPRTL